MLTPAAAVVMEMQCFEPVSVEGEQVGVRGVVGVVAAVVAEPHMALRELSRHCGEVAEVAQVLEGDLHPRSPGGGDDVVKDCGELFLVLVGELAKHPVFQVVIGVGLLAHDYLYAGGNPQRRSTRLCFSGRCDLPPSPCA